MVEEGRQHNGVVVVLVDVKGPLTEGFSWYVAIAGIAKAEARRPLARIVGGELACQCFSEFLARGGDRSAVLESIEPAWARYFDFTIFECSVGVDVQTTRRRLFVAVILAVGSPLAWSQVRRRPAWGYVQGEVPPVL